MIIYKEQFDEDTIYALIIDEKQRNFFHLNVDHFQSLHDYAEFLVDVKCKFDEEYTDEESISKRYPKSFYIHELE